MPNLGWLLVKLRTKSRVVRDASTKHILGEKSNILMGDVTLNQ